jgi:probable rRNA maturation factor
MPSGSMDPDDLSGGLEIALANRQSAHPVDDERLLRAVRNVLRDSPLRRAAVSVAVVDDATIHELNRRYLDHDWPTDVLSFVLDDDDGCLEGEVILSADTAAAAAPEYGWSAADEQLLYAIHGTLHLVGYDDQTDEDARQMRAAEERYLRRLGARLPASEIPPLPEGEGRSWTRSHHEEGGKSTP